MKKKLVVLSGTVMGFAPLVALAQGTTITGNTSTGCQIGNQGTLFGLLCRVGQLLNAVIPVLIALGVLYFVWGVVSYVIASDEEAKSAGKDRIIYGRLVVNENLQLASHKNVFALGDTASFLDKDSGKPVPALAQVAVKEARVAAENIKFLIENRTLKPFKYKSSGTLVSIGQWMAVGEIWGLPISGRFTWWIWRTVYLFKLISFTKKVKVAIDWTVNIFFPRDISQL